MLRVTLAGLVLQGVLTVEEAEFIDEYLSHFVVPETVKEVVETIDKLKYEFNEYKKKK